MSFPLNLLPSPRHLVLQGGHWYPKASLLLQGPPAWMAPLEKDREALAARLGSMPPGVTRIELVQDAQECRSAIAPQAYRLTVQPDRVMLHAAAPEGARYGIRTLHRLLEMSPVPCCQIDDEPLFAWRGVQVDLGRVIERPDTIRRLLPLYASFNYNLLQLYVEDALAFEKAPEIGRPFAWSHGDALEVVEEARRYGIETIPAIQSLGHSSWTRRVPKYEHLDEGYERGERLGMLCPSHSQTLEVIEAMIRSVAPLATSGIIHIGMDESFHLGKCSRCRSRMKRIGESGLFVEHANRVAGLVRAVGKRPAMWGDMFYYHDQALGRLDKDVLIFDWYYYGFPRVPRVELYGFADLDTKALWKRHGLTSWGCPASVWTPMMPMNLPSESINNARSWVNYHRDERDGIMVTQWELAPTSIDLALPIEGAIAGLLWSGEGENASLLSSACRTLYGRPELAGMLEELGRWRLHGHADRAWLAATSLSQMVTHEPPDRDAAAAEHLRALGNRIDHLAAGVCNGDMVQTFAAAARWLAYQYQKRASLNRAVDCVDRGAYSEAERVLVSLAREAASLPDIWQAIWNKNRHPGDVSELSNASRLQRDLMLLSQEVDALQSAAMGRPYAGVLLDPVVAVHLVNSHPACQRVAVSISRDSESFNLCGQGWLIMFDTRAARPTSDDRLTYRFPIGHLAHARYVKVSAQAAGQFSLAGVSVHCGSRRWHGRLVRVEGQVEDAEALRHGGVARMGCPDPQALFARLRDEGESGRIFSMEHASIIFEVPYENTY